MREILQPAINALQQKLRDYERKVSETKALINSLCEESGDPPMYAEVGSPSQPSITSIRADTFYGKVIATACREYLEMRRAANLGPAETREIFEALKQGGYPFETADAANAMTGIRQVLRKNSGQFHRLPNNSWGLTSWYERIKQRKVSLQPDDDKDTKDAKLDETSTEDEHLQDEDIEDGVEENEAAEPLEDRPLH